MHQNYAYILQATKKCWVFNDVATDLVNTVEYNHYMSNTNNNQAPKGIAGAQNICSPQ